MTHISVDDSLGLLVKVLAPREARFVVVDAITAIRLPAIDHLLADQVAVAALDVVGKVEDSMAHGCS